MRTPQENAAPVEAVVLDWDDALRSGTDPGTLARCVERLQGAGTDVVLVVEAGREHQVTVAFASPPAGPGKAFVWAGDPPLVHQVGDSAGARVAPPDTDAVTWAGSWLTGPGAPGAVLQLTGPPLPALERVAAAAETFPEPVVDESWRLEVTGVDQGRERDVESWLTVANGRSGTRGMLEEGAFDAATAFYVAGVYGRPDSAHSVPELVRAPEWTSLAPRADSEDVDLYRGEILEHRRVLDMRQGIVRRDWRQGLPSGEEWRFRSVRFASLADRAVAGMAAEASAGRAGVSLEGEIPLPHGQSGIEAVEADASGSIVRVSLRPRGAHRLGMAISTHEQGGSLERIVALDRSRGGDRPSPEEALGDAESAGLGTLLARHRRAWRERWRDADVVVEGPGVDVRLQRAVRFALYHLISSGDPESDLASVGARGLTGPGYGGRVFWDTEVFVLPFFIWTHPQTARALLSYRYRTLPAARHKARKFGYPGALYAWESADTGEEATPPYAWLPDGSRLDVVTGLKEHHISADVARAVWQYWLVTGDDEFLVGKGAEILLETARFWAGRAEPGRNGRYHITDLVGPDEYHEGVDDNAFTNAMARWNLLAAADVCERLPSLDFSAWKALTAGIGLGAGEPDRWREVAGALVDGLDEATGLYEQFAGFWDLEDVKAVDLAPRPFTGEMVVGAQRLGRTQIVKQADVVMLAHVLPEVVSPDVALANYRYYEPRTSHGSSLSPAIHAAVAARLALLDDAERYFRMAAALDLENKMGNAAHGVHIATMGGVWQAAVLGFGGVGAGGDALRIDPHLPPSWSKLGFSVQWRGTTVRVEVTPEDVSLNLDGRASVAFGPAGRAEVLGPGSVVARRKAGRWMVTG